MILHQFFGPGTAPLTLHILLLLFFFFLFLLFLLGRPSSRKPKFRRFKSDCDEICQECSTQLNSTQLKFIENGSRMAKRIQNTVHKNKSNDKCE